MENKKLKLYNLLTLILAFVFLAFSIVSVALIPLTKFEFGFLSLDPGILKEVFTHISLYFDLTIISVQHIIGFIVFTVLEVVLLIIMVINLIILIVKVFGFLNTNKEYKERKEKFTKFARKALVIMSFSTILFLTSTNLGALPVMGKMVSVILVCVAFVAATLMDVLFDKPLANGESTTLDVGLTILKRLVSFAAVLITVLSMNKFQNIFEVFANELIGGQNHSPETLRIIGCLLSSAFYIALTIIVLKGFRKYTTRGAFSINKKNPYRRLFVTGILVITFGIIILVTFQFACYVKFVSISQLFQDLRMLMLVPILASISGMVISFDREKKEKKEAE